MPKIKTKTKMKTKAKAKSKTKSPRAKRPSCRGMQNKRYRKTEEAILEVLLKSKQMPSTQELTKRARISRSTLYRHHRAMPGIIPDYERDILIAFKREKFLKQKDLNLENTYFKALIFILHHKRVFKILFKYSGDRVAENMVLTMKDKILHEYRPTAKNPELTLKIYAKEVAGIMEHWGNNNFSEQEINHTLKNISNLTITMKQRLSSVL